jgi:hypothetical protein
LTSVANDDILGATQTPEHAMLIRFECELEVMEEDETLASTEERITQAVNDITSNLQKLEYHGLQVEELTFIQ